MIRYAAVFVVGFALLTMAACADDGPLQKPNVSEEQMAQDRAACRRLAKDEAERDLVLTEERRQSPRDSRTGAYMSQMNRFSARKDRDDLYERCMARRGYTRKAGSDPKSRFEAQSAPQAEPPPQPR